MTDTRGRASIGKPGIGNKEQCYKQLEYIKNYKSQMEGSLIGKS